MMSYPRSLQTSLAGRFKLLIYLVLTTRKRAIVFNNTLSMTTEQKHSLCYWAGVAGGSCEVMA